MNSRVKQQLAAGGEAISAKVCYQDPELVELMASGVVEALWLCLEHRKIPPDPLADIRNTRRIHRVIHGGVVLDPVELLRLVPAH
ncbi:MAG: hypothetical protein EXS42_08820 [Lacunisphaera sp.]|nr:hypothetical protein [Lacunisphaera sp.]